jgi:hypothetical protein
VFGHDLVNPVDAADSLEGIGSGCAENRAALLADPLDLWHPERDDVTFYDPAPAVAKANEFLVVNLGSREDSASDNGIEARGISTAREDSNSHESIVVYRAMTQSRVGA